MCGALGRGGGARGRRVPPGREALRPRRPPVLRPAVRAAAVCRLPARRIFPRVCGGDAGDAVQGRARGAFGGRGRRAARVPRGRGGRARGGGLSALLFRVGGDGPLLSAADRAARARARPAGRERPALRGRLPDRRDLPPRGADGAGGVFAFDGLRLHRRRHPHHPRAGKQAAAASGRRYPRLYQLRREDARLPDGRRRLLPASVSRRRRPVCGGAAARLRGGAAAAPADPRRGGVRPRNGASAASPPAPRAPFLAFFRKTVYNKGRNGGDGISRRALGAPLVHLHLPLCGGGQRGEYARARLPRLFLPVLSDGRDAVAGGAGGARGHRREGERGGHPRPLLRRGSVRGVHAGVRRRLSHLHPDLFALRVGRRRRRARGGRAPRAGHGSRADGRRLRDILSRLRASLRGRARRKPARRGAPRAAVLSSQEGS